MRQRTLDVELGEALVECHRRGVALYALGHRLGKPPRPGAGFTGGRLFAAGFF